MVYYVRKGKVPEFRHTYDSRDNILKEELFGEESFDGPYSLLYHRTEPTRVISVSGERKPESSMGLTENRLHRHIKGYELKRSGNYITGRVDLLVNSKLKIGMLKPEHSSVNLYRNAYYDEIFFIHEGSGKVTTPFGKLHYRKGDYLYIPKGTTYHMENGKTDTMLYVQSRERISITKRYLNIYGQLKEGTPFYSRDFVVPEFTETEKLDGDFNVYVEYDNEFIIEKRDRTPFDLAGWDGYLYPFTINVEKMAPIVGKLHQPPPVHENFSASSFMIGAFLPRKFDFHPRSIPISYYHSNIDTDEFLFYSSGNFMSRKGISPESMTLHIRGLIHGPQPGAVENAIGKESTDEVAIMVEAYEPLKLTQKAVSMDDPDYMKSWVS
jgi:homogentisate 1,2-dioxygenase